MPPRLVEQLAADRGRAPPAPAAVPSPTNQTWAPVADRLHRGAASGWRRPPLGSALPTPLRPPSAAMRQEPPNRVMLVPSKEKQRSRASSGAAREPVLARDTQTRVVLEECGEARWRLFFRRSEVDQRQQSRRSGTGSDPCHGRSLPSRDPQPMTDDLQPPHSAARWRGSRKVGTSRRGRTGGGGWAKGCGSWDRNEGRHRVGDRLSVAFARLESQGMVSMVIGAAAAEKGSPSLDAERDAAARPSGCYHRH